MKKWDKTRWAAEILFHLVMLFGAFTSGCFMAPRGKQDIAVGIYIVAVIVCVACLHIYLDWRVEP